MASSRDVVVLGGSGYCGVEGNVGHEAWGHLRCCDSSSTRKRSFPMTGNVWRGLLPELDSVGSHRESVPHHQVSVLLARTPDL